jgi:Flp pilus assembly protein TadB
MNEPIANIQVTMSIPPQKYMAAAMEIMSQYGTVVEDALRDIKEDLMFNRKFQEEVKIAIKEQVRESVENAIKSAARRVVWDLYRNKDQDIEQMIENAILDVTKK